MLYRFTDTQKSTWYVQTSPEELRIMRRVVKQNPTTYEMELEIPAGQTYLIVRKCYGSVGTESCQFFKAVTSKGLLRIEESEVVKLKLDYPPIDPALASSDPQVMYYTQEVLTADKVTENKTGYPAAESLAPLKISGADTGRFRSDIPNKSNPPRSNKTPTKVVEVATPEVTQEVTPEDSKAITPEVVAAVFDSNVPAYKRIDRRKIKLVMRRSS